MIDKVDSYKKIKDVLQNDLGWNFKEFDFNDLKEIQTGFKLNEQTFITEIKLRIFNIDDGNFFLFTFTTPSSNESKIISQYDKNLHKTINEYNTTALRGKGFILEGDDNNFDIVYRYVLDSKLMSINSENFKELATLLVQQAFKFFNGLFLAPMGDENDSK